MGQRLVAVATPVSNIDMKQALSQSWQRVVGDNPTERALYLLLAHWSLETGGGSKMMNFNVGNKKARLNGSFGDFVVFRTWEILDGKRVDMDDAFRAYPTLDAGCDDYLKGLKTGNFSRAFPAIIAGDPVEFAHQLKLAKYYTASEDAYKKLMRARFLTYAGEGKYKDRDSLVQALEQAGFHDVMSFQASQNLVVDNVAGPQTKGALYLAVNP